MLALGIKNVDLAAACNVRPPSSFNWASGKTKQIKGATLLLAAKALGVRPQWLATGIGPMLTEEIYYSTAESTSAAARVSEPDSPLYMATPATDSLTQELVSLFSKLEAHDKREWLANLRGFVAGRCLNHSG
jgi:hypothetical protein